MASELRNLNYLGFSDSCTLFWNLPTVSLVNHCISNGHGKLASNLALSIDTGEFTGRSPQDRFIVLDDITKNTVYWDDKFNFPFYPDDFDALFIRLVEYFESRAVYIRDAYACADQRFTKRIRIISEYAWTDLFAYNMFIRNLENPTEIFNPDWHVICAPGFNAIPKRDKTPSKNFSIINFSKKCIIIGGTGFTGEVKKGVFTVLNFILPTESNVLPMHCAANIGEKNDTALFFGLSGTGKTTLSSNDSRKLVGDDEHGWSDSTIFNFEGGCYARTINLTIESEPQIYSAIKFGSLLENIGFERDQVTPDYFYSKKTVNTRVSYPLNYIPNSVIPSIAPIPTNIFFLTCDAFGVLPPVSLLTTGQAKYYFINGYSAKIPGSEIGVEKPTAIFSTCYGGPFLPLPAVKYCEMLGEKLVESNIKVWLINTGWIGGGYGVGKRIKLEYSRLIIDTILQDELNNIPFDSNNIFSLAVPTVYFAQT